MMRVCVFGAGALGSAVGGMLAAENEVLLVGRDPHMSTVRQKGLTLTGDVRRKVKVDAASDLGGQQPPELIIVTVKAFDTQGAVKVCRRWAGVHTRVLTLQNGLGNLELLRAWKGPYAFGGTTTMGAQLLAPGKVRVSGLGKTVVGSDADRRSALELGEMFASCGLPVEVTDDIITEIWSKAVVSACINPLTAVLRVPNGSLIENDAIARMVGDICLECVNVAKAEGINLSPGGLEKRVWKVAEDTSRNRSSMLRDVENSRRTEIEQINGAFVRAAARHNVSVPINRALTAMVGTLAGCRAVGKG